MKSQFCFHLHRFFHSGNESFEGEDVGLVSHVAECVLELLLDIVTLEVLPREFHLRWFDLQASRDDILAELDLVRFDLLSQGEDVAPELDLSGQAVVDLVVDECGELIDNA